MMIGLADSPKKLPKYKIAPVVEVAASAQFAEPTQFKSVDIQSLWERFGKTEYSQYSEQPPIVDANQSEGVINISPALLMARQWFMSSDKTTLIQFQRDRFIYNWRKIEDEKNLACANYPHYENVIRKFFQHFNELSGFLSEREYREYAVPDISQLELGYVNFVPISELGNPINLGKVFRDFTSSCSGRYLPDPEKLNFIRQFTGTSLNSVATVQLATAQRIEDGSLVFKLEIGVKGKPSGQSNEHLKEWFDAAHEWIVLSFDDLLVPEMHTKWERYYA